MKPRSDLFEIGDLVTPVMKDEYGTDWGVLDMIAKRHGSGPYRVDAIKDAPPSITGEPVLHPQLLVIDGDEISGWWFKPER